jgi:biotin transport system substrate-specific component
MPDIFAIHRLVWVALMAALIAIGAFISIPLPFTPVPLTLQDMFVLLAGLLLGPKRGFMAVLLYIAAGSIGLPVFAGGKAGVGVLLGPTGGYLVGYLLAVVIYAAAGRQPFWLGFLICAAGALFLLALGSLRLAYVLDIPTVQALAGGMLPFLPGSAIKIFCALTISKILKKNKLFPHD